MFTSGRRILAAIAMVAPTVLSAEPADLKLPIGSPLPVTSILLKNVDGRKLALSELAGPRGTLVIFTCNACPMAKAWEGRIVELGNAFSRRGVGVVLVDSNDPRVIPEDDFATVQERARVMKMRFPFVVDEQSELARLFRASRTPEVFLFSATRKLVYHGAVDDNAKEPGKVKSHYLRDALEATVRGAEVTVQETKAFGCGIKFRPKV